MASSTPVRVRWFSPEQKNPCEASVLRRKLVWNKLNCASSIAASDMYSSSFFIIDWEQKCLNPDSLLGKGLLGSKLAATLVHFVSKPSDVNMSVMDCMMCELRCAEWLEYLCGDTVWRFIVFLQLLDAFCE